MRFFFKCARKIRNNHKIVENGRKNINFEDTAEERKSREYLLPVRISINEKAPIARKQLGHIIMIRGGFQE